MHTQAELIERLEESKLEVLELREAAAVKTELEALLKIVQAENIALKRAKDALEKDGKIQACE